jgi:hypothetical protein
MIVVEIDILTCSASSTTIFLTREEKDTNRNKPSNPFLAFNRWTSVIHIFAQTEYVGDALWQKAG